MAINATRLNPELEAGGFQRDSGHIQFFTRVNALLSPEMTVVDLGAGRGSIFQMGVDDYGVRLSRLQGKVKHVIGLDVDDGILEHPYLDERHVIDPSANFPMADESVDLIVADWVLEHVADPVHLAKEVGRVLKPGGWFCARTPNRWGYVGIGVRMIPNALHVGLLKYFNAGRPSIDTFPTCYRLNSIGDLRRYFPGAGWKNCSYYFSPNPRYFGGSTLLFRAFSVYQTVVPHALKTDLFVFVRKL